MFECVCSGGDESGEVAPGRSQDEEGSGHGVRLRQWDHDPAPLSSERNHHLYIQTGRGRSFTSHTVHTHTDTWHVHELHTVCLMHVSPALIWLAGLVRRDLEAGFVVVCRLMAELYTMCKLSYHCAYCNGLSLWVHAFVLTCGRWSHNSKNVCWV